MSTRRLFEETTHNIRVCVEPVFLPDQSDPEDGQYVWAYHIAIENRGHDTVQLLSRYWRITDAQGRVQEVRGAGVVGEQPVIAPGARHEYTSGVPLPTPSGFMGGQYQMQNAAGARFDVVIPLFSLESPFEERRIH